MLRPPGGTACWRSTFPSRTDSNHNTGDGHKYCDRPGQPEIGPPAIRERVSCDVGRHGSQKGEHAGDNSRARSMLVASCLGRRGITVDVDFLGFEVLNVDTRRATRIRLRANVRDTCDSDILLA